MFDPVTSRNVSGGPTATSLLTRVPLASRDAQGTRLDPCRPIDEFRRRPSRVVVRQRCKRGERLGLA
jgi:hypothetical protein